MEHFRKVQNLAGQVGIIMFVETGYGDVAYQGDRRILVVSKIGRKEVEDPQTTRPSRRRPRRAETEGFSSAARSLAWRRGAEKAVYEPSAHSRSTYRHVRPQPSGDRPADIRAQLGFWFRWFFRWLLRARGQTARRTARPATRGNPFSSSSRISMMSSGSSGFTDQVQHLRFSRKASAGVLKPRDFRCVQLMAQVRSSMSRAV